MSGESSPLRSGPDPGFLDQVVDLYEEIAYEVIEPYRTRDDDPTGIEYPYTPRGMGDPNGSKIRRDAPKKARAAVEFLCALDDAYRLNREGDQARSQSMMFLAGVRAGEIQSLDEQTRKAGETKRAKRDRQAERARILYAELEREHPELIGLKSELYPLLREALKAEGISDHSPRTLDAYLNAEQL